MAGQHSSDSTSSRSPPTPARPVVRMMDYGKYKYDQSVKAREARKNQTRTVIKEVQFRPKIGASDYEVKKQARRQVPPPRRQGEVHDALPRT